MHKGKCTPILTAASKVDNTREIETPDNWQENVEIMKCEWAEVNYSYIQQKGWILEIGQLIYMLIWLIYVYNCLIKSSYKGDIFSSD